MEPGGEARIPAGGENTVAAASAPPRTPVPAAGDVGDPFADVDWPDEEYGWVPEGWVPAGGAGERAEREALARIDRVLDSLAGSPVAVELLACLAQAVEDAASTSYSTLAPVTGTAAGSVQEALAVVAAISQVRTALSAREDQAMVEAGDRIRAVNTAQGRQGEDGVVTNLALARRVSSEKTSRQLARARRLVRDMPRLYAAKRSARIPEDTATAITGALAGTTPELRGDIDAVIAGSEEALARWDGLGVERIEQLVRDEVRSRSSREESVERAEQAGRRRYLRRRALADGMTRLTAVLPAFQAAQIETVVQAAAESERAAGSRIPLGALRVDMLHEAVMRFHDATVLEPDPDDDYYQNSQGTLPVGHDTRPAANANATSDAPGPSRSGAIDGACVTAGATGTGHAPGGPARAGDLLEGDPVDLGSDVLVEDDLPTSIGLESCSGSGRSGAFGPLGTGRGPSLTGPPPRVRRPRRRPFGPRVQVCVIITDRALLGRDDTHDYAALSGYGRLPAHLIRSELSGQAPGRAPEWWGLSAQELEQRSLDAVAHAELRRVWQYPASGEIQAVEKTARAFRASLREMILTRDEISREPWSNAASRHVDHITPHAEGGKTSYDNGQGLSIRANQAKEEGRWVTIRHGDPTKPTGTRLQWTSPFAVTATSPTPPLHRPDQDPSTTTNDTD